MMKKHFNKELVMNKQYHEYFWNSTKYWISDNDYVDNDVKIRDHCHNTGKYRGSSYRDYNINLKLDYKFLSYFTT